MLPHSNMSADGRGGPETGAHDAVDQIFRTEDSSLGRSTDSEDDGSKQGESISFGSERFASPLACMSFSGRFSAKPGVEYWFYHTVVLLLGVQSPTASAEAVEQLELYPALLQMRFLQPLRTLTIPTTPTLTWTDPATPLAVKQQAAALLVGLQWTTPSSVLQVRRPLSTNLRLLRLPQSDRSLPFQAHRPVLPLPLHGGWWPDPSFQQLLASSGRSGCPGTRPPCFRRWPGC